MDLEDRVKLLKRQNRWLTVLVCVLILIVCVVAVVAASEVLCDDPPINLDCYRDFIQDVRVNGVKVEFERLDDSWLPWLTLRSERGRILLRSRVDDLASPPGE